MPEFPGGKIIVPIDFSDESFAAVDVAIDIAGDSSNVAAVHVLADHHEHDLLADAVDHAKRRNVAEQTVRQRFDDPQHRQIGVDVEFGDPGHRIAEFAQLKHAKLIVMPSHGRTGLKRLFLGSVAERVVRLAHCPVLVLRSPPASKA